MERKSKKPALERKFQNAVESQFRTIYMSADRSAIMKMQLERKSDFQVGAQYVAQLKKNPMERKFKNAVEAQFQTKNQSTILFFYPKKNIQNVSRAQLERNSKTQLRFVSQNATSKTHRSSI